MDSEVLVRMFDYIEQQQVDVHGILVVRNGYTVVEAYYPPYGPNTRHGTASVGKSFTGALVGIAIREGYIEGVDQKVADFFPEHSDWQDDPLKQAMTIEHLLTMTYGLDWPESAASYSSSQNIMNQMMRSPDWVRFVLDRPMVAAPGTVFNYSSGASHLLSAIDHLVEDRRLCLQSPERGLEVLVRLRRLRDIVEVATDPRHLETVFDEDFLRGSVRTDDGELLDDDPLPRFPDDLDPDAEIVGDLSIREPRTDRGTHVEDDGIDVPSSLFSASIGTDHRRPPPTW